MNTQFLKRCIQGVWALCLFVGIFFLQGGCGRCGDVPKAKGEGAFEAKIPYHLIPESSFGFFVVTKSGLETFVEKYWVGGAHFGWPTTDGEVLDSLFKKMLGVNWKVPRQIFFIVLAPEKRSLKKGSAGMKMGVGWDLVAITKAGKGAVKHGSPAGDVGGGVGGTGGVPCYKLVEDLVVAQVGERAFWGTREAVGRLVFLSKKTGRSMKKDSWKHVNGCFGSKKRQSVVCGGVDLKRYRKWAKQGGGERQLKAQSVSAQSASALPLSGAVETRQAVSGKGADWLWALDWVCLTIRKDGTLKGLMAGKKKSLAHAEKSLTEMFEGMELHLSSMKSKIHVRGDKKRRRQVEKALKAVRALRLKKTAGRVEVEIRDGGWILSLL